MYDYLQFIKYEKFVFFKLFFGDSPPPQKKCLKLRVFFIYFGIFIYFLIYFIFYYYIYGIYFLLLLKKNKKRIKKNKKRIIKNY